MLAAHERRATVGLAIPNVLTFDTQTPFAMAIRVPTCALIFILSLQLDAVQSHGQSPGFVHYQPYSLDFSSYRQNQMLMMQAMPSVIEENRRRQAEELRAEEEYIQSTRLQIKQVRDYYNSFPVYPLVVPDGKHPVKAIDDVGILCFDFEVDVKDNQVVGFYHDLMSYPSAPILRCTATLRIRVPNGEHFVNLYFLDSLTAGR